jgi:hypothetical protein
MSTTTIPLTSKEKQRRSDLLQRFKEGTLHYQNSNNSNSNSNSNNNEVPIDRELYERISVLVMRLGLHMELEARRQEEGEDNDNNESQSLYDCAYTGLRCPFILSILKTAFSEKDHNKCIRCQL